MWKWLVMLAALPILKLIGAILEIRDDQRRLRHRLRTRFNHSPDLAAPGA